MIEAVSDTVEYTRIDFARTGQPASDDASELREVRAHDLSFLTKSGFRFMAAQAAGASFNESPAELKAAQPEDLLLSEGALEALSLPMFSGDLTPLDVQPEEWDEDPLFSHLAGAGDVD